MRHLGSLIAGIVIAPLAWLLIAFGQYGSGTAFAKAASTGTYHSVDFVKPLIFLAVAGILVGLIATLRISPVGSLIAGLAYLGSYIALLISPKSTFDALNYTLKAVGQRGDLTTPLTSGVAAVVGALLLVAVFSVGRWRHWPRPESATPAGDPVADPADGSGSTGEPPWTTPAWTAPAGATDVTTDTAAGGDLPNRTASWPTARTSDETTESVPAKGRSPWDTPLREGEPDPPR